MGKRAYRQVAAFVEREEPAATERPPVARPSREPLSGVPCSRLAVGPRAGYFPCPARAGCDFRSDPIREKIPSVPLRGELTLRGILRGREQVGHTDDSVRRGEWRDGLMLLMQGKTLIAEVRGFIGKRSGASIDFDRALPEVDNPVIGDAGLCIEGSLCLLVIVEGGIGNLHE